MEEKKTEAIKRMRILGLFEPCIRAFDKRDEVQFSEVTGGLYEFSADEELTREVREFEREYDALVYHVIHSFMSFGPNDTMEMYSFLYVSDQKDEWSYENADIKDSYVFVYVWNKTAPYCSEFGTIRVAPRFGGLIRKG